MPERLNPFAFVSDTSPRLVLLVVLVTSSSGRRWSEIGFGVFDLGLRADACMQGRPFLNPDSAIVYRAGACLAALTRATVVPSVVLGLFLLVGFTWLIYRAYPHWQVWRLRLERLDPTEVPDLAASLNALCHTAGLRQRPEFWWNPLDGRAIALAFGTHRHRRVALTGAVALQLHTDPEAFRVVILHELAHIRNGDVSLTYVTLSIWWAFLATALLPAAVAGALTIDLAGPQKELLGFAILATDVALVTLCILFARNAVLRARELYADARSFAWHRDMAGMTKVLTSLASIPRSRRFLSPHPAPSQRQRLLTDTDEMFRFGAWDSFGTGLSAGIATVSLVLVAVLFILVPSKSQPDGMTLTLPIFFVPFLITISLAAGTVATGTWRAAFLALMRGRRGAPILRTAAACATGGVLGSLLPSASALLVMAAYSLGAGSLWLDVNAKLLVLTGGALVLLILFLTMALAAFLAWVEVTARCWLTASLLKASPRSVFVLWLTLTLLVAIPWVVFVPWGTGLTIYSIYKEGRSGGDDGVSTTFFFVASAVQVLPTGPIAWFGLVALWAFPLSAGLLTRRRTAGSWAFLDDAPACTINLPALPIYLGRAILIGIFGGIATIVVAASLFGLGLSEPESIDQLIARLVTGAMAQGVVAMATVLVISRAALPHAMCAAFFTGCVFGAGEILRMQVSPNWNVSFAFITLIMFFVLFAGALVALVCASTTSLLAAPIRWFRTNVH
jgi:Zn-dependent protease with chaperone function